jgi:DNA-binding response OmpR family regulator
VVHGTKVLIVEDEHTLGDNLRQYLERRGWNALVARTGGMAVAACTSFQPGVILLDYQLPDMDGFQVLAMIRQSHGCGCILMTAHPVEEVSAMAQRHAIRSILYKPFSLAEMEKHLFTEYGVSSSLSIRQ